MTLKANYQNKICKKCLLPKLDRDQQLSETSYLFASLHCLCDTPNSPAISNAKRQQSGPGAKAKASLPRCTNCGKQIASSIRSGSMTGFIFAPFRCQCSNAANRPSSDHAMDSHTQGSDTFKHHTRILQRLDRPNADGPNDTDSKTHATRLFQAAKRTRFNQTQAFLQNDSARQLLTLAPGDLIASTFKLEAPVGEGGMGIVFRARHNILGRTCALKFLIPSAVSEANWKLFKNEARILNTLNHPGMCKLYDIGIHQSALPYLAMEYIDGTTLENLLVKQGTLSIAASLQIFIAVAQALAYAHRHGIVHRDIKPGNIMLSPKPGGQADVKILDFGISGAGIEGGVIGSAFYMSPEQFTNEPLEATSDIYSLGCALYETLSGLPPFVDDEIAILSHLHQTQPVPPLPITDKKLFAEINALIAKCLAKSPIQRYQNMSQFAIDAQNILDEKPLQFAQPEYFKAIDSELAENSISPKKADSSRGAKARIATTIGALAAVCLLIAFTGKIFTSPVSRPPYRNGLENSIQQKNNKQDVTEMPLPLAPKEELDFDKFINDTTRSSASTNSISRFLLNSDRLGKPIEVNGKKYWEFSFPLDADICKIGYSNDYSLQMVNCEGVVRIPQCSHIALIPSQHTQIAGLLSRKAHQDIFTEFVIEGVDTQLPDINDLKTWTRLSTLRFRQARFPSGYLLKIAELKHLKALVLTDCFLKPKELQQTNLASKMTVLGISGLERSAEREKILEQVIAGATINQLILSAPLYKKDLDQLARMTTLKQLIIDGYGLSMNDLQTIVKLPLHRLILKTVPPNMPDGTLDRLRKEHPQLTIKLAGNAA